MQFVLVFEPRVRKEKFVAEIRLRKLVGGFLREQADPHLDKGIARLRQIEVLLKVANGKESRIEVLVGKRFYRVGIGK